MLQERPRSEVEEDLALAFDERRRQLQAVAARAGREDASDVVQESFLKAVEAGRKAPVDKPLNFLRRIARNVVIDRLRAKQRAAAVFSGMIAPDAVDLGASPERALIASQRLASAIRIIESMPERRREVFLLHRLEELTLSQCAKRLGISVKMVEKHMAGAMAQLSREIGHD